MRNALMSLLLITALSACGKSAENPTDNGDGSDTTPIHSLDIGNIETKTIVATSQITPPEPIVQASVAVKPGFMAWQSHILLLSNTGKVYTANTAFNSVTLVHEGPFDEIFGLDNGELPALFLARDERGLRAFKESGDFFEQISLTGLESSNINLCEANATAPQTVFIQDSETGVETQLKFELGENELSFVETDYYSDLISGDLLNCQKTWQLRGRGTGFVGYIFVQDERLIARLGDKAVWLQVDAGLTIPGIETPIWTYSTPAAMGNVFNNGLTLVRGLGDDRLVMIANDYIMREVFDTPAPATPNQ